ncbi:MAG: PD40 domain-containing protein [Deltaproteobacteria bacterium]|nr:PD40 domain-containing protein [Deltaproteobacteria bacterium]
MLLGAGCGDDGDGGEDGAGAEGGGGPQPGPPDPLPFAPAESRDDGALRLTSSAGTASNQNPCFAPDGSFLVFTRFESGYNAGPAHIWRLDLDGSEPVQLTAGDYDDVNVPFGCFSAQSGRVVFASDREEANDFWTVSPEPDAPDLQRLTDHGELPVWIEPVFSPDAARVAFEQNIDEAEGELDQRASVWIVDLATGQAERLTNPDDTLDDRLPSWSPDGATILFQHRVPPSELWEVFLVPAVGGAAENLSAKADKSSGSDTDLSWSPDGRWVASSADPDGIVHPNIFLLPLAGGQLVRVTASSEHEDGAPCVSPNGLWVAFESHRTADEESASDIWIARVPEAARP